MKKPIRIVQDIKHPNMYRLQWKDGSLSCKYYDPEYPMKDGGPNSYGMYNLTRAKDILKNYESYIVEMNKAKTMLKNKRANCSKKLTDESLDDES